MKIERPVILVFSFLGIISGLISNYFTDAVLSVSIPIIIFIISLSPMIKTVKGKKRKWLLQNSIITFVLVWLVVWIFFLNLR